MKYAQLIIGLLVGTALGGSVVASTGMAPAPAAGTLNPDAVKVIVREVIKNEPELLIQSLQSFQEKEQQRQMQSANDLVKNPEIRKQLFEDPNAAIGGNKNGKHTVVEFFDYDCGACKMMFVSVKALIEKDKEARIIFHEYPIFGPTSDANSKIGIAVNRLYPDKYYDFHVKMMSHEGRVDQKTSLKYVADLGMDATKVEEESKKQEVADIIEANHMLGDKLGIRGTPTFVIGNELVPHGMSFEDLEAKAKASEDASAPAPETPKEDEPEKGTNDKTE